MNITELNNALLEVREAIAERDRLARELDRAEHSLGEERSTFQRLSDDLQKENGDVRRLESTSLVGVFFAVMGTKETRLEKERQEVLAAKLKYNNAQRRVAGLERDVTDLRDRVSRLETHSPSLPELYASLLAEKERQLSAQGSPIASQLAEMDSKLANLRAGERELIEAVQAGDQAEVGLCAVVEALESASGWGTWDLLGGGVIASAVKHGKLDEAHDAAQAVQPLLQRFERELADVGGSAGLQIESGGLATFADIFIDGLLVDLLVQSRINESLNAARAMHKRVVDILARLSANQEQLKHQIEAQESARRELLEKP